MDGFEQTLYCVRLMRGGRKHLLGSYTVHRLGWPNVDR